MDIQAEFIISKNSGLKLDFTREIRQHFLWILYYLRHEPEKSLGFVGGIFGCTC